MSQDLKLVAAQTLLDARRDSERDRLHPHEASRQSRLRTAREARRSTSRGSTAIAARCSAPRRWPDSRAGKYRVLVATDIAARGIDVEALSHVVNFDVPNVPEDYIHRVGRTARAEMTGDAITFVAPDEENDLRAIERAIGKRLPRVTRPRFRLHAKPAEKLEIPIQERIAAIRARKAEDRARAKAKLERKASAQAAPTRRTGSPTRPAAPSKAPSRPSTSRRTRRRP